MKECVDFYAYVMKINNYCLLLILLLLNFSCSTEEEMEDNTLSFDKVSIMSKGHLLYDSSSNGWRLTEGNAKIDWTTDLYKNIASLVVAPDRSSGLTQISFLLNTQEFETNKIIFSGKYKTSPSNIKAGKLIVSISYYYQTKFSKDSTVVHLAPKDTLWSDFKLSSFPISGVKFISFEISSIDSLAYRIADCKVSINDQPLAKVINTEYEAEKDNEFNYGSGINLGNILSPQKIENIEVLGKVWGFLKYYHPEVVKGKYNWDYELFRILAPVVNAKDVDERSHLLNKWIDNLGRVRESSELLIADSSHYSRIIDLSWINDRALFDKKLILKLNKIKNAKRSKTFNYYVVPYKTRIKKQAFAKERAYENIKWDDQGFRILTLFRLWNIFEYCFPYRDMTDTPWAKLLRQFIPAFFNPENKATYEASIIRLMAHCNDSHGYILIPNKDPKNKTLDPIHCQCKYQLPVELIQSKEGYIVVKSTESLFLNRGDIILSVNGKSIEDRIEEMKPYTIASNENGLIRKILPTLLSSDNPELKVTVLRGIAKMNISVTNFNPTREKQSVKLWNEYNLEDKNIIHVDNIKSAELNRKTIQDNLKSRGIIIDMRKYPKDNLEDIYDVLFPSIIYPLRLSFNELDSPGNFKWSWYDQLKIENANYYKGKVAVLVDENTQSAGETLSIWFSMTPINAVIGRKTAGANGNISLNCPLPHGINIIYSGLGAYYLNGDVLQRNGVKIDIPASPGVQDIIEGRDVWIEKAIEYIMNK